MSTTCIKLDPPLAIVAGKRTPFVKAFGALSGIAADQLGVMAVRESLKEAGLKADEVDEVVMGNVCGQSDAPNIARVIALRSGIPQDRIAHTVNRNCASGMESVFQASQIIRDGRAEVIVAGGTESMSQVPFLYNDEAKKWFMKLRKAKKIQDKLALLVQLRPSQFKPVPLLQLGLTDPTCAMNMGETAEGIADDFDISRKRQDEFAVESHLKTIKAQEAGFFNDELLLVPGGITGTAPLHEDLGPRKKQSMENLGKLKPFFRRTNGTVTVGNSCTVTDGAVSLVVMSAKTAEQRGLKPLGYMNAYSIAGCDPKRMGLGPVFAIDKLLQGTEKSMSDFDLVEINEAFAAQVLGCQAALSSPQFNKDVLKRDEPIGEVPSEKLNVNGGAIALGHPVGATGARLILTNLRALKQKELSHGLVSLCVGGGQGVAIWLERA